MMKKTLPPGPSLSPQEIQARAQELVLLELTYQPAARFRAFGFGVSIGALLVLSVQALIP